MALPSVFQEPNADEMTAEIIRRIKLQIPNLDDSLQSPGRIIPEQVAGYIYDAIQYNQLTALQSYVDYAESDNLDQVASRLSDSA